MFGGQHDGHSPERIGPRGGGEEGQEGQGCQGGHSLVEEVVSAPCNLVCVGGEEGEEAVAKVYHQVQPAC